MAPMSAETSDSMLASQGELYVRMSGYWMRDTRTSPNRGTVHAARSYRSDWAEFAARCVTCGQDPLPTPPPAGRGI